MFKKNMSLLLAAALCLSLFAGAVGVRAEEGQQAAPDTSTSESVNPETSGSVTPDNSEPVVKTLLERLLECKSIGSIVEIYNASKAEVEALSAADQDKLIARYNELAAAEGAAPYVRPVTGTDTTTTADTTTTGTDTTTTGTDTTTTGTDTTTTGTDTTTTGTDKPVTDSDKPVTDPDKPVVEGDAAQPKLLTAAELLSMEDYEALTAALTEAQISSLSEEDKAAVEARQAELKVPYEASKAVADPILAKETYADMKAAYEALSEADKAALLPKHKDAIEAKLASLDSLIAKVNACATLDELNALVSNYSEEEIRAMIDAHHDEFVTKYAELLAPTYSTSEPEQLPAEEIRPDSKHYFPAENVLGAAPFKAPIDPIMPFNFLNLTDGEPDKGVTVDKTATANKDGTYQIALDTYATGSQIITESKKDVPVDIVLVLDQSGSMKDEIPTAGGYFPYIGDDRINEKLYAQRTNSGKKNLYYKKGDGSFVAVNVDITNDPSATPVYSYERIELTFLGIPLGTNEQNGYYARHEGNLWAQTEQGVYKKVHVDYDLLGLTYTYTLEENNQVISTSHTVGAIPHFDGLFVDGLYHRTEQTGGDKFYVYSYVEGGKTKIIGKAQGPQSVFDGAVLYSYTPEGTISKREALKNALKSFVQQVVEKSYGPDGAPGTPDDIKHRIAVVGFASGESNENKYENTELFVGSQRISYQVLGLPGSKDGQGVAKFKEAFQNVYTSEGLNNVTASINGLHSSGATHTHYGMYMAEKILQDNPVDESRARAVVLFTDGAPTLHSGFMREKVAIPAINTADNIKNMGKKPDGTGGVAVYAVGVFEGANGESDGVDPGKDLESKEFKEGEVTKAAKDACNWFLQRLSSNNGTHRTPTYYMSAANSEALNTVFKQIADQIQSGGSTSKLDKNAIITDVIAPEFKLPKNASASDIQLNTYKCTGVNIQTGAYTWVEDNSVLGNPTVTVNGDKISVTGFDFAEHYVGTVTDASGKVSYRGHKLQITFNVEPKPGFLGGNDVYTNTNAYLYENQKKLDENAPLMEYPHPQVNVPIKPVTVTTPDGYVYLNGSVTESDLPVTATTHKGKIVLDPSLPNYGLEEWQTKYVTITNSYTGTNQNNLIDDTTYSATVTIKPKNPNPVSTEGKKAEETVGQSTGKIMVLKPTVDWKDSQINLGDKADFMNDNGEKVDFNFTNKVTWKHGDIVDTSVKDQIIGTSKDAPVLTYEFDKKETGLKEDTPVKVTVKIGTTDVTAHTTFTHETVCNFDGCKWGDPGFDNCQFIVHIKSFDLTIKKVVTGATNHNDSFVFRITGPNGFDQTVVLRGGESVTIQGLPSGDYKVQEIVDWSKTYNLTGITGGKNDVSNGKVVDAQNNKVTFTNQYHGNTPLTGESHVENMWQSDGTINPTTK